jgi:hypothetical protein
LNGEFSMKSPETSATKPPRSPTTKWRILLAKHARLRFAFDRREQCALSMLVQLFLSAVRSDGAYSQVIGVKKQARVARHPHIGARRCECSKGIFRALSPWREGALGAAPRFRRAFAARPLLRL